jgi:hypothetical protein
MGIFVTTGAQCLCSFGTAPAVINATSQTTVMMENKPVATIMDCQPNTNIPPFAMCTSLANPTVAAATAAALGVLTPQPCTMVPAGTWIPTQTTVLAGGKPCLTNDCKLTCGFGMGTIMVTTPGQSKTVGK